MEKDVERMVRDAMRRNSQSFKQTINEALRISFVGKITAIKPTHFKVKARPLGLRTGIDVHGYNKLTDDLEADAFLAAHKRNRFG